MFSIMYVIESMNINYIDACYAPTNLKKRWVQLYRYFTV